MKQEHILKAELLTSPFNTEVIVFRASKIPQEKSFRIVTTEEQLAKVRRELKEIEND